MWGQCYAVSRQLLQRGELDFTTRLLPQPCARLLTNEDRLLLSSTSTTSYPSRLWWTDVQQWIRHFRSSSSNIIVRLLEEAKSQVQTKRCMVN